MTREEADFIGGMNMCDEISNEAYKKIMCHCEEQELCEDCVSRAELKNELMTAFLEENDYSFLCDVIDLLPSVTPRQKMGRWILLDECSNSGYYCSECQKKVVKEGWSNTVKKVKFCPNCGAKMEV